MAPATKTYDLLVIGGGSGGIATALRAAKYGAKVALIERGRLGGRCLNVGCVPKQIMFNTAMHAEMIDEHRDYGFDVELKSFDWSVIKRRRDGHIKRLRSTYEANLRESNVEVIIGHAEFMQDKSVEVNGQKYSASHILVATGDRPNVPDTSGAEYGITSDDFFDLETLPKKTVVSGDDTTAVELAGIVNALDSDTTLLIEHNRVLRNYDKMISKEVTEELEYAEIYVRRKTQITSVAKIRAGNLSIETNHGTIDDVDCLIWAGGRKPNIEIGLDKVGVELEQGHIKVDDLQNTIVSGIYALGGVCGKALPTSVTIAAGQQLAARLFNNEPNAKQDYNTVPRVVFSQPPVGTVGLTEGEALSKHGAAKLKIYRSTVKPLYHAVTEEAVMTRMKMICLLPEEKVIGLHMVGDSADEILQGFALAVKIGATKKDFDNCVASHPTTGEELVTMT